MVLLRTPPGPPHVPVAGSLPLIGLGKAVGLGPPPHVRMAQLADTYGDVMELRMGREPWVVLSSPEAVHEAFVLKGADFSGRPMVPSMSVSSGGGQGFAQAKLTPELAKLRRTAFGELFDAPQVERSRVQLEDEAALLAEHLLSETARLGAAELRPALRRAVTNMVLRYAFSVRAPYASEAGASAAPLIGELVDVVEQIWTALTATPTTMADLLAAPAVAAAYHRASPLRELVARRDALLRALVAQRRAGARRDGGAPRDMLDALLDARLSEEEVLYSLVDLFVAGVNTVSTSLEWLLLLTTSAPQVQARARADALGGEGAYVGALLKETLRAKPPLLLPRQAVADSSIGGYAVPRGRVVLANNWALTQSPAWWVAPRQFRPERWLEEEAALERAGGAAACKFIPYSVGRRACPGSRLAEAELSAAARTLLRTVRWARDAELELAESYSLTLAPAAAQRLRFERLAQPAARPRAARRRAAVPTMSAAGRSGARATRQQKLGAAELGEAAGRLREAATDRRGGWRASKAKGARRNRRYEKRLLKGAGEEVGDWQHQQLGLGEAEF